MPQLAGAAAAWAVTAWTSAVTVVNTAMVAAAGAALPGLSFGAQLAVANFATKAAVFGGLAAASAALMRPNIPSSGTSLDFKPDPKAPIRGAMGYTALGGNKVFQATWGYKRVAMSLGVALSLGPIDQVPRFEADGATVTFSGPQNEATGFYAADMWQRTTLGLPGDAALLPPTGLKYGNPGLTGWGTQHAASQVSFSFWTMVLAKNPEDRDVFTNGVPDPRWIGRWMKLWDPRKDSTYPGGSGPQRRDDWRTWEWSESPYVHALAWCRGHYKLNLDGTIDRTKRIAGIGAPDAAIDIPAFVEGMNVAQANNWTISGEWSTSDGKFQTLLAMLQAGGGEPISRGAQISVLVNAPRVATYTYTRDDLIGLAEIRPLTPRRERKNTIVPRYKSEANGWQYVPAGEVTSSVYRDEDRGEPRSLEIEYTHVRNAKQAGQLAAYDLANLREGLTATLPSKVHLMHVHPGDCITVDVPELALAGQKFVVRRATVNHQAASVTLELRSESDGKHAWALGQAAQPAPSPSLSAVDPKYVPPPAPEDWTAVPKPPGSGGVSQPIVIIELPIETTDIVAVIIKHGPSAAGPWTDGYEGSPRPDGRYEVAGLAPGQTYCFSLQYVAKNGAKSDPDIKCGIVAGDLIAGDTTHLKGEPVQDILDLLTSTADLADQNRQAVEALEEVYGDTASAAASAAAAAIERASAEAAAALSANKAEDAAASAVAASTAAGDAVGSASASAASASVASTKADEAAVSASASTAAKTGAETARGQAQAAATNAASSRDDAAGSAASASASATNAANSRDAAAGSASAAAGSASTATTAAGEAGVSAAAAQASQVIASTAAKGASDQAAGLLYSAFDSQETWTTQGSPAGPISGLATTTYPVVNDPDLGLCLEFTHPTAAVTFTHKGPVYGVGKRHRLILKAKCVTPGTTATSFRDFRLNAGLGYLAAGTMSQPAASAGQIVEYVQEVATGQRLSNTAGAEYVRFGVTVSGTWRLSLFSVEDITESTAAGASATAAATSASSASASEAAAGQSANAASGSAVTAATKAGDASAFANQAAGSAADAAGSAVTASQASGTSVSARDTAIGARNDAQAAAATSVAQSSAATAAAADAKLSANLAAQIGGGSLNQNPTFTAWSGALPDGYGVLSAANGTYTKVSGRNGQPNALRTASAGTADFGFNQFVEGAKAGGEWVVLEVDVSLEAGSFAGSGIAMSSRTASGALVTHNYSFMAEFGAGATGRAYRFSRLVDLRHANAVRYGVNAWTRWSTFAPSSATTLDWQRVSIRPATEGEIAAGTVLPAVQAQASLALSTSVDALTQLGQAAFELILASGGLPAYIKALAEPGGTEIAFAATKLFLRNVVGDQIVTALELINGEAYFGAPVSVDISGRRLTIGPGFGVSSGLVLWFGPNTVSLASMSRTNGYFALGTDGKVYYGNAELGAGGGTGGAAMMRASCAGSVNNTSFATLASVTFANRPATGWWDASIFGLSGSSDGFADNDIEFRVIEQGATTPLATATITVPAGVPGLLSPYFSPSAPWPQTRPAGNLTLLLQARRAGGLGSSTFSAGDFTVNYTPGL